MTDGVGSETYTHNNVGEITQVRKNIDGTDYDAGYAYNDAGAITSLDYPSATAITQTFDAIGRLSEVKNGATSYLTVNSYNAAGQPLSMQYHNTTGAIGEFTYNARLQLESLVYRQGTTEHLSLDYQYTTTPTSGDNNGQIKEITDGLDSTRTTTYTYDAWSRLKTAVNGDFDLRWEYDRFGNREEQVANPGLGIDLAVDKNTNRLTWIGAAAPDYDDSGNMTQDDQKKYTFDAEGRITEVRTLADVLEATYSYDGNGLRVKKVIAGGDTTRYVFSGSKVIAEYVNGAAVSAPASEYVYAGSRMLATLDSGGTSTYSHQDHLSTRVQTDSNGNVVREFGHQPFGEAWYETGSVDKWKFTNYERDSESGLDYATFRFDATRLGRFMSPDPVAPSLQNPQSHNRYTYTHNDPVNRIDPLGLIDHHHREISFADCMLFEGKLPGCGVYNNQMAMFDHNSHPAAGRRRLREKRTGEKDPHTEEEHAACANRLFRYALDELGLRPYINVAESEYTGTGTTFDVVFVNETELRDMMKADKKNWSPWGPGWRGRDNPSVNVKIKKGRLDFDYWGLGTDLVGAVGHAFEVLRNWLTGSVTDPCEVQDRIGLSGSG